MRFYRERVGGRLPWDAEDDCPDFDAVREGVRRWLREHPVRETLYDFVLVDEGQDLDERAFAILKLASRHVTVCLDHKQQIYEKGSSEDQILRALGLRKRNFSLLEAYRCTPYIVRIASSFIADERERLNYMRQTRMPQVERETPLLYVARDYPDELARLTEVLRTRQTKGDSVAVVLPHNRQVLGLARDLVEAGFRVEVRIKGRMGHGFAALDFGSNLPKLVTYHSVKGLTFDSVLMPQLRGDSFTGRGMNTERLLFVGITRALKWVYLSTDHEESLPLRDRFSELERAGHLSIQRWDSRGRPSREPPTGGGPEDGGDISDFF